MALTVESAQAEIAKLTDPTNDGFVGFPATKAQAAINWATVCRAIFEEHLTIPPGVAELLEDATEEIHDDAYDAALDAMAEFVPDALTNIPLGFQAYAVAMATSFAAALLAAYGGAFTGPAVVTPPATAFVLPAAVTDDGAAAALAIATVVDAWAKTGTFVLPFNTPPGPLSPAPWA